MNNNIKNLINEYQNFMDELDFDENDDIQDLVNDYNKKIDKNYKKPKGSMSYNDDPVEKKWTFKDEVISVFNSFNLSLTKF